MPFGEHMVSGYVRAPGGREFVFDYRYGVRPLGRELPFPAMPDLARNTPMSLWNLALETHTGRIYGVFLGKVQPLWTALSGLCILVVLLTGSLWWWRTRRRWRPPPRNRISATPCGVRR